MSHIEDIAGKIAARIGEEHFGTGPLAQLRRMNPRAATSGAPALHRLLADYVEEREAARNFHRWSLLIHLLALAAPDHLQGEKPLGQALFAASYSEARLTQLLEADESAFPVILPRMVRFLTAKGQKLPTIELAYVTLGIKLDDGRRRIADAYYRAERNAKRENP